MRAWRTHEYGQPRDVLQLDTIDIPEPEAGELRVRVQAIPLNLNDLERINGGNMMVRPDLPYIPGMEVMGVVDASGPGAEAPRRRARGRDDEAGARRVRRVRDLPVDLRRSRCPTTSRCPDAAALYFPFHLAWLGLFDRAELQAGESVLIHAAAGGSGSAAVQLAVDAGAQVFATAGTDEKVAAVPRARRRRGDQLQRRRTSPRSCSAETGNRGVDVVFDNVGESVFEKSLKCTAYNGRYLMMGFASNKVVADEPFVVPRRLALGNLKLCGVLLAYAGRRHMAELVKTAMGWNFAPGRARRADHAARSSTASVPVAIRAGRRFRWSASRRSRPRSRRSRTARRPAA